MRANLFLLTFEINNGDSRYYSKSTVEAESIAEAEKLAEHYIWDYWGITTRINDELAERKVFWNEEQTESIKIYAIEQVTPEQLAKKLTINGY